MFYEIYPPIKGQCLNTFGRGKCGVLYTVHCISLSMESSRTNAQTRKEKKKKANKNTILI